MIKFLALFFFSTSAISLAAQTRLDTLLQERKDLYIEYSLLKEKRSNFWGTQSKADLKKIIDNLKTIITKDDEIVKEVNRQHEEKQIQIKQESAFRQTDNTLKNRNYTDLIYELNDQVASLSKVNNNLLKEKESLFKSTEAVYDAKASLEKLLLFGFILLLGLFLYIMWLRKKLKKTI